ncbi:hypothetical protein B0T16DRAFT_245994 [Cercophora newfieldiana]|uniref:Uncharacterized protein n=1 Tax=Cercophora newfieldiana TaxID=92897 RepID=A0AA39XTM3_9PEZI|nr:hypothetical protein B0T16DRAFT_245994 [Cercophora newfieldiana]
MNRERFEELNVVSVWASIFPLGWAASSDLAKAVASFQEIERLFATEAPLPSETYRHRSTFRWGGARKRIAHAPIGKLGWVRGFVSCGRLLSSITAHNGSGNRAIPPWIAQNASVSSIRGLSFILLLSYMSEMGD